ALVQRVERVVHGGVRDGVVQRHPCGVLVEEKVGRRERDVFQRLAILSLRELGAHRLLAAVPRRDVRPQDVLLQSDGDRRRGPCLDRKSTRLNSSHVSISYAVFCLKKKKHDRDGALSRASALLLACVGYT